MHSDARLDHGRLAALHAALGQKVGQVALLLQLVRAREGRAQLRLHLVEGALGEGARVGVGLLVDLQGQAASARDDQHRGRAGLIVAHELERHGAGERGGVGDASREGAVAVLLAQTDDDAGLNYVT